MKWLGAKLKAIVSAQKLTQEEFADAIKVSRITVGDWFKDQPPKGIHLMKICKFLDIEPKILFEETSSYTIAKHRKKANAKSTPKREALTEKLVKSFHPIFHEKISESLKHSITYSKTTEPAKIAMELRKLLGFNDCDDCAIKIQDVFKLADKLSIFVIPIPFDDDIKSSAFFTCYNNHDKVVFVNTQSNISDIVYLLLHELCHAIINNCQMEINEDEEAFCEQTASLSQFPKDYRLLVLDKVNNVNTMTLKINVLKYFSYKNHHSIYGIAKVLNEFHDQKFDLAQIGKEMSKMRKETSSLKDALCSSDNISSFIKKYQDLFPQYFNHVILKIYKNATDRRLCELLGVSDSFNAKDLRDQLEQIENDF